MCNVLYIYNIEQCSFYLRYGINPIDVGIHNVTKRVWHKYVKNDKLQKVYELWLNRCTEYKENLQ